uniref:Reverse transcriptase domain-containing protein n=1 Tax=Seriola lalandi dorsalis TaxID=1841481 RepID=A0A3B4ZB39_SERLL
IKNIRSFFGSLNLPNLTVEQCDLYDAPITVEEIVEVIKRLLSGKAPGIDIFLDMYTETFETGILPSSLMDGVVTVISKSGKNPTDCKSYMPISLPGYDEQVLSKLLSKRLNKVITTLIHLDQSGFLPKCIYADNIRCLINIKLYNSPQLPYL